MKTYSFENYTIRIGQSDKENTALVRSSDPFDLWFHVHDHPSAHVIVSQDLSTSTEIEYSPEVIREAARLCAEHSKLKHAKNVKISYTEIGNVSLNMKIYGRVTVKNEKYVKV